MDAVGPTLDRTGWLLWLRANSRVLGVDLLIRAQMSTVHTPGRTLVMRNWWGGVWTLDFYAFGLLLLADDRTGSFLILF